ncbi:hypothetical protein IMCC26134_15080 [Verrucomicrobia bacterium IMCC26134]|nr:hypothetical protein IMCC26134_15080 [Verrucomicrobia bacterium IMCC26134]
MPSWSRSQAAAFAAQGAAHRHATDAEPATYAGQEICVYYTAIRTGREIEAGGFGVLPDIVARVNMAIYPDFTPVKGALLTIGGVPYLIGEIAAIHRGGEWWFALGKA